MAKTKTLEDMFVDVLKDILFAERQILRTLPKMARAAQSQELKAAIEKHKDQTEGQIERLEKVFEQMEVAARGKTCPAILGIIEEGQEVLEEFKVGDVVAYCGKRAEWEDGDFVEPGEVGMSESSGHLMIDDDED